ncbi:MAG: TatD family nuclease-associated radical SAM protein [Endomicrobiaceae bacterium]|nr:TatD family nuclease-associated radical SAM protein [Endomicrobiaceae bacterium]
MDTLSYKYGNSLYLNITNRCMMACPYCIKQKWAGKFRGDSLNLSKEPTSQEVINSIIDPLKYNEIVFCGYGDALIRLEEVKEIATWIKSKGGKVRINTAGLANKFHNRNILPELKGLIDVISVSLNGSTPQEHNKFNNPMFKEKSFDAIIDFIKLAKNYIPIVIVTAVELPELDTKKIKQIANSLGVTFRSRQYLDEYEEN